LAGVPDFLQPMVTATTHTGNRSRRDTRDMLFIEISTAALECR
jgi:hypothetical protein